MEEEDFVVSGDDGGSDTEAPSWDGSEKGSVSSSVDRPPPTKKTARLGRVQKVKKSARKSVRRHRASSEEEEEEEEMGLYSQLTANICNMHPNIICNTHPFRSSALEIHGHALPTTPP